MDITIRHEREDEFHSVEEMTREAFWNLYFPGCDEHFLVHQMRTHCDYLPKYSLVAEVDGAIVGTIMYSRSWLISVSGEEREIVSFGPLCVAPQYQRKGVGTTLMNKSFELLKADAVSAVVILGDPHNYCKQGFKSGKDYNIADAEGNFPYGLLALELKDGTFGGDSWRYKYSDLFDLDEQEVAVYDERFPPKEKVYHYSQEIFSIAIRSYLR